MASNRIGSLATRMMGRKKTPMAGKVMFHSVDGAFDGGELNASKRARMRIALHKHRLRASGMSDDLFGSKEVGGAQQNQREYQA